MSVICDFSKFVKLSRFNSGAETQWMHTGTPMKSMWLPSENIIISVQQ